MIRIGLTGGIGAGKSLVLAQFRRLRVPTLSTDALAHQALARPFLRRRLVRRLGPGVLDPRGRLSRPALARLVFTRPKTRRILEAVLHPWIRHEVVRWERKLEGRAHPPRAAVVEVPLLFERGWDRFFDGVMSVSAPRAVRRKRLAARGWSRAEIIRREKIQWSQARKDRRADWVVPNDGTPALLARRLGAWWTAFSVKANR